MQTNTFLNQSIELRPHDARVMPSCVIQVHLIVMVKIMKRVPFDLCDPVGILFYGAIHTLAHQALEEALPKIGITWDEWFNSDQGAPVRRVECDYYRPLKGNEVFEFEVSFINPTDSSITVHYVVKKEDKVHCDIKVLKVFVDRKTMTKTKMPDKYKKIFALD
jgi:acyl-CoA thioesterase FadM